MNRALPVLAALLSAVAHADDGAPQRDLWSRLWQTDDQYAQRLLRSGDAAAAARSFDDPRHRAFAQAQAGQHAEAAQAFSAFDDSDAHYNRGNALARSGELQAALDAYETALQRDPGNDDAAHNRDLVRAQLEKEQKQQQNGQSGDANPDQQQQSQPSQNEGQDGGHDRGQSGSSEADSGENAAQQSGSQSADTAQKNEAGGSQPRSAADEREQAEQDARAGVAQQQQQDRREPQQARGETTDEAPPPDAPQQGFEQQTPKTEADLAAEQWLQRIPDDPGGLLRRKFMMEHMLRQQEQGQ